MTKLSAGDVIELPVGMNVYHNQGQEVLVLENPAMVVIEAIRICPVGSEDDHFESCIMCDAHALLPNGDYHPEGAFLTFAQAGDFRPEFIVPDTPNMVLRKMVKTYLKIE